MAHLTYSFHVGLTVDDFDEVVKDPRTWPTFWVGMEGSPRVFGDGSPGTKAEFYQHMMGVRMRMVDRTLEERHNADGSTDWRWRFEGAVQGEISCHHEPSDAGTDVTTTFDYHISRRLGGRHHRPAPAREAHAPRLRGQHGQPAVARRDHADPGGCRGLTRSSGPGLPTSGPRPRQHSKAARRRGGPDLQRESRGRRTLAHDASGRRMR